MTNAEMTYSLRALFPAVEIDVNNQWDDLRKAFRRAISMTRRDERFVAFIPDGWGVEKIAGSIAGFDA